MNTTMIKVLLFLTGMFVSLGLMAEDPGAYKVIVNSGNSVSSVSKQQLADIFLKKLSQWENGQKIVPVDQNESSPARIRFSKEILGKAVSAVEVYWQQQVFSGRGFPPIEKTNDADVIAYIKSNTGAVGYVSAGANTDEVKVLKVN